MRNTQTKATAKYQAKVGLVARSYKLKKSVADEFKRACKISGETQAAVLTRFMTEYTEDVKQNDEYTGKSEVDDDEMMFINDDINTKMIVKCRDCGSEIIINKYEYLKANEVKPATLCKKCDSAYIMNLR